MSETFQVLLWGETQDDTMLVRNVHVEDPDEDLWGLLEQVFYYGQNEIQPNPNRRSVMTGDLVYINGEYYACEEVGWSRVSTGELLGVS